LHLAQHGADVAVNYVNSAAAAESVAEKIRSLGVRAITVKADVSKKTDIKALFEEVMEEFGRLDIVLSNSGIEHFGSVPTVTEAEMDKILRVDVKGQFFVTQHVQASSR
jgi:NAD(P)-dependent dehydrogenase (short-subunit alcohol dehydrogenase family)